MARRNAQQAQDPEDLMHSSEAGRILGLSSEMVRKLANQKRLPAQRTTSGVRMYRRADVERLRIEREKDQAAAAARAKRNAG